MTNKYQNLALIGIWELGFVWYYWYIFGFGIFRTSGSGSIIPNFLRFGFYFNNVQLGSGFIWNYALQAV